MSRVSVQPAKPIRSARGKRPWRYYVHVIELENPKGVERYVLARHRDGRGLEFWCSRETGWHEPGAYRAKRYTRYSEAYKTLRKLQAIDAASVTAAGRKARLAKLAPQLLATLDELAQYVGGSDTALPHPCAKAHRLLEYVRREL